MDRKKTKDKPKDENVMVLTAPPAEPPLGSKVIKNVTATRVEKFTEVVTPSTDSQPGASQSAVAAPQSTITELVKNGDEEEPLETVDIVRSLLEQVEKENADYVLHVFRLPNFDIDGKRGTRGTVRKFLDRIDVTLDYLPEVKARFGGGTFQFFLLNPKRQITGRWTEHIDGPPRIEDTPVALPSPALPMLAAQPAGSPVEPLNQLMEFATTWAQLRKLVMGDMPSLPVQVAANPAPIIVSGDGDEESDPDVALILGLLNSGNPRAASLAEGLILKRYGTGSGPSMGEMLERLVEPFIPSIQMGVADYFKRQMGATQPQRGVTVRGNETSAQSDAQQPNSAADGGIAGTDPAQLPPDDGEDNMSDESYLDLAESLMMLMGVGVHQPQTFDSMVSQAADLVVVYQREHEEFADWIDSLLMMAPKGVLTSLVMLIPDAAPLRTEPEALRFVEQLQLKLKEYPPEVGLTFSVGPSLPATD